MNHIIRIILGVVIIIAGFLIKGKATSADGQEVSSILLFGSEISQSSLTLIVAAFVIAGLVVIALGVVGMIKSK